MGEGMNKFLNLLGFGNDPEEDYDEDDYMENIDSKDQDTTLKEDFFSKKKSKVVNLPNASQAKVVIMQPNCYDNSSEICEHLKEKKSVIINLEFVNKDVARRIIDFVCGSIYGLDGNIYPVSNSIYLATPFNYEVTNEMSREELIKNKMGLSWIKQQKMGNE